MTDDEKKKLMGRQYYDSRIDEFNPTIDKDKLNQAFENKTIIADGQNVNEVNHIVEQITKQHELFKTKIIIQDIIAAYKGDITWDSYLQARKLQIADVRQHNQRGIINLKNPSEYKIDYLLEPPMLDFTAFMIAEALGKLERKEDDNKNVL